MVEKMKPEDVSNQLLCVTARTKDRVLNLRKFRDRHEEVVVRLLDFWDEDHEESRKNVREESEN